MKRGARRSLLVMLAVAALGVSACGDDDESTTTGANNAAGIQESTGSQQDEAVTAAKAAAEAAGEPVELPQKTAGILQIVGSVQSAQRAEAALTDAINSLGWELIRCDAQGDPIKMAQCGDSLLDRNADVMFTIGIEPSLIKAQLQKADRNDVPVVSCCGLVAEDDLWAGKYHPDDAQSGVILAQWVNDQLATAEGSHEAAIFDYPADWSKVRTEEFRKSIEEQPDLDLIADLTTDAANLVPGTRKQVSDTLTANPDLDVMWFGFSSAGAAGAPVVNAEFPGQQFPDRPLMVTFDADSQTQELIRQGAVDAVADVPFDLTAWVGVDQAAEYFAREKPFDTSPRPTYDGCEYVDNQIVTKENLPAKGEFRRPPCDAVTFFQEKWKQEFTNVGE